jgi:hypothetical protein
MDHLTVEELKNMTGAKRRHEAKAWLRARKVPYEMRTDGWPSVHRAHTDKLYGVKPGKRERPSAGMKLDHLKGPDGQTSQA